MVCVSIKVSKVQPKIDGGNASCTSKPQKWGKPGRFHDPDFLRNVTLKKLKRNADFEEIKPKKKRCTFDPRAPKHRCKGEPGGTCFDFSKLDEITNGSAAVLYSLGHKSQCDLFDVCCDLNVHSVETVTCHPVPISLVRISEKLRQENSFDDFKIKIFENIQFTGPQVSEIYKSTLDRHKSASWFEHRIGRITGSRISDVV